MSEDLKEHAFQMESFKASIEHFLVKHHAIIEELNLMHGVIEEYLMEIRVRAGITEAKDNVVPLFHYHRSQNDEPEDIA